MHTSDVSHAHQESGRRKQTQTQPGTQQQKGKTRDRTERDRTERDRTWRGNTKDQSKGEGISGSPVPGSED